MHEHMKLPSDHCLASKEEILATADEDIWNNSRASESSIPRIHCLDVDDNEINPSKENIKDKNVKDNEEDNEDNEKELELLLRHHFIRTRGSSRDESHEYVSKPLKFPNDQQGLGEKVDSGLVRQPLPISSLTGHILQEQEMQNTQRYSTVYDYSQLPPEKQSAVESVNNSAQSLECSSTSEILLSQEYWPGTKENEAAYITDVMASKQGMSHTDVSKDETDSITGSETIKRLFISEHDYDQHQEAWERNSETVPLNPSEPIPLKESILEEWGDNVKPVHEQYVHKSSFQTSDSLLENIVINEPKKEILDNKNQPYLRGALHDNTFADVDVVITSLGRPHTKGNDVEEKYKTEYNIHKGKEIKLSILEHPSEKDQAYPLTANPADSKHLIEKQNQSWLSTTDSYEFDVATEVSQGEVVKPSSELGEVEAETINESTELPWLNKDSSVKRNIEKESSILSKDFNIMDNHSEDTHIIQFCTSNPNFVTTKGEATPTHFASINQKDVFDAGGNVEKRKYCQSYNPENISILEAEPCQNESERVITGGESNRVGLENQSWSALESQLAERESEANKRVEMKERTGGEAMWGIRDNTRCLNVTPTNELFTCQDSVRYEESSVAEYDSAGGAEAGTAAYIIKMTSESTPEKMSAGEKAVIVKLPQETALSDRPTEEKETVFDIHEGRNDGSHYPLCQCNTVGVLYDTKFEKESVSDIYNARTHETVQGEMMSVPNASKKLARAELNSGNDSPLSEILWTSAAEGKAIMEQDLPSETSLNVSQYPQPGLHNELAGEEIILGTFHYVDTKTEHKMSPNENEVSSSYKGTSTPASVESMEVHIAERGNPSHPHIESSVNISVFSPTSIITEFIPTISTEEEFQDPPQSSALLPSGVEGGRSVDEFVQQPELKVGKSLGPTILISQPTEDTEEPGFGSEGITEEETLNLNTEGYDNQTRFDHAEISGQQNGACSLAAECQVLKQIGYKILYFLLFVVFCVTLYHYDLIVCFAMYLFSLYWLYCEGRRSKESVKKD
ncbi:protein phosphatase 1 regulatory subunit 3A isoform X2 [Paroedura picta]|uniref:protein phosphatase 1 regulatory subunit 3A isoform X2 n=1 Tax=Paroedura picta TaxID=143630 RepID=UPI004056E5C3